MPTPQREPRGVCVKVWLGRGRRASEGQRSDTHSVIQLCQAIHGLSDSKQRGSLVVVLGEE
jgi:hypothetical protein